MWAAHQLERWVRRLALERHIAAPELDPVLADVRNALEHLDEAELGEFTAIAGDHPRRNRSLRNLPGGQLFIGTSRHPRRLFDLIDSAEIERRAFAVTTTAYRLDDEAEDYVRDVVSRGEGPPGSAEGEDEDDS